MALIIPHSLKPGLAPHPFFVRAKVRELVKSRIVSPQGEDARREFVEAPMRAAFEEALAAGEPEAYAKSARERARLNAEQALFDLTAQDRRSSVVLEFYITEAEANDPHAEPAHRDSLVFDYDLDSEKNALHQAYEAAKADPRFAGATDA